MAKNIQCVSSPRRTVFARTQRAHRILLSSWCAIITCTPHSAVQAQAQETFNSKQAESSPSSDTLSTREEELRRKEAELLRAISAGDSVQTNPSSREGAVPNTQGADSKKISAPVVAPIPAVHSAPDESTHSPAVTQPETDLSPQIRALQEMGNHPALEPKRATKPAIMQQPKASSRGPNSTVRKPDTFRRVERDRDIADITPRLFANSRTVSLQEIEAERVRHAPFEYEAIATIAGRDATLRAGPKSIDRALGSAPRFSEVSIDYRSGDWYRVQTNTGLRGWIHGRNLLFDAGISPSSTVRIGAVKVGNLARQTYRR